jgi:hypothetical protein
MVWGLFWDELGIIWDGLRMVWGWCGGHLGIIWGSFRLSLAMWDYYVVLNIGLIVGKERPLR